MPRARRFVTKRGSGQRIYNVALIAWGILMKRERNAMRREESGVNIP
jgi:hypothetical protein